MLLSMTGFGEARGQDESLVVSAEVRTINNRYFKLVGKFPEGFGAAEASIDALVRKFVKRGTVQVTLRVQRARPADAYKLNIDALNSYREQLEKLHDQWHVTETVNVERLLALPGVVEENTTDSADLEAEWPLIEQVLSEALTRLDQMRRDEGAAMASDLAANCATIKQELEKIEARAPQVVADYRDRLRERVSSLLSELDVSVQAADLIREVGIFAERSDIAEEIVRLRSHLQQFDTILNAAESAGRKLEFLTQEMFRETNTIGSKANDTQIAQHVVEIKSAVEKLREMIQNVE